jgi:hypothetical protein
MRWILNITNGAEYLIPQSGKYLQRVNKNSGVNLGYSAT